MKLRHLKRLLQSLRDVRPANFFLFEIDDVLLNNWGSAASVGTPVLVQGSPEDVCHPNLIGAGEIAPQPKHDSYSLVASVSDLLVPGLKRDSRRAFFQEAIDAANREDHDAVASAFESISVLQRNSALGGGSLPFEAS